MRTDDLRRAIASAQEFERRAALLLEQLERKEARHVVVGNAISGSCRRASLDLTRNLAILRDPWRRRRVG